MKITKKRDKIYEIMKKLSLNPQLKLRSRTKLWLQLNLLTSFKASELKNIFEKTVTETNKHIDKFNKTQLNKRSNYPTISITKLEHSKLAENAQRLIGEKTIFTHPLVLSIKQQQELYSIRYSQELAKLHTNKILDYMEIKEKNKREKIIELINKIYSETPKKEYAENLEKLFKTPYEFDKFRNILANSIDKTMNTHPVPKY